MQKDLASARGVRAVAVFELSKGLLSLVAGIVLIALLHRDLNAAAADVLRYLRVDATGYVARLLLENAAYINESNIKLFIGLAFAYTLVRFVEAYGLWRLRAWAEWFAIIAGAIYLPFEIYEIFRQPTWLKFIIFFLNVALVGYLIYVRRKAIYDKNQKANETKIL